MFCFVLSNVTTGKILNLEPCCNILEEEIDVVSLGEVLRMNPSGAASQVKSPSTPVAATTAGPVSHAPIRLKLKGKRKTQFEKFVPFRKSWLIARLTQHRRSRLI